MNNKKYLYEGLSLKYKQSMQLWESAGTKLVEAQLTAQQITQLFQQIEQGATAAGGNRTAIGQVKDAGSAVVKAYQDLKAKAINSQPMQNADALYDQAAEKLKQATGGDQGVMQYVQKYRTFAKAHPIAQSLIYGALIAAAGITGAGAGGAAALGLFKMVDKLLQGEKFSTAAVAGAETGALAYGASKVGDMIRGGDTTTTTTNYSQHTTGMQPASPWDIPDAWKQKYPVDQFVYKSDGMDYFEVFDQAGRKVANFDTSGMMENSALSESQISALFGHIVIAEGLWDQFKQRAQQTAQRAAGAVVQKAQTVGKNITTKVTADKLQKAWKAAGSPTDSKVLVNVLTSAGVSPDVISNAYTSLGIKASSSAKPKQKPKPKQNKSTASEYPGIDIATMTPAQKLEMLKQLDALDAAEAQTTQPVATKPKMAIADPRLNPALQTKTSTGGTITPTATGMTHTANPNNPNLQAQQVTAPVQQAKTTKNKAQPISVGGQKINPNDPKYASLLQQLQQAKGTA